MSGPICVGDLVVLVRGHSCLIEKMGGVPFTVRAIHPATLNFRCSFCGQLNIHAPSVHVCGDAQPYKHIPLSWLKRIPPLVELETNEIAETV